MHAPTSSARWAVFAASALWLLHGCTMEPRYRAPALPVPEQWPLPATTAAPAESPAAPTETAGSTSEADAAASMAVWDIGWRDFFADARLQQLIAQALANNRDLRAAVLNIQLARAQYRVQRSALLLSLIHI